MIRGTLSCQPGTPLTRLGISNTHPPELKVQTESVKYVDIANFYHYVHKPLSGIVSKVWARDISDLGVFHYIKGNIAHMKDNMALTKGNMAQRHVRNG